MYKTLISITLISLLLTGCGTDTTPSGSILSEINERQLTNKDDVAKVIKDYYTRVMNDVNDDKCQTLSTKSSNAIDQSIVELAKKNCANSTGIESAIQRVLDKVNSEKSMKLVMTDVDDSSEWLVTGLTAKQIKELKSYGLSLSEYKRWAIHKVINNRYNGLGYRGIVGFLKLDVNTVDDLAQWEKKAYAINLKMIKHWHSIGIKDYDLAAEWLKINGSSQNISKIMTVTGIKDPNEYLKWKKGLSLRGFKSIYDIKRWKEDGFTADELIAWKKAGYQIANNFKLEHLKLIKGKVSIEEWKEWDTSLLKPDGVNSTEWRHNHSVLSRYYISDILIFKELGITANEFKNSSFSMKSHDEAMKFLQNGGNIQDLSTEKYQDFLYGRT